MARDAGMSLVEVIVYLAVAVLVTLGLSTMFASGVSASTSTKNRDTATGQAQLITTALQIGIRNSSAFTVTDNLLRARVATGEADWRCDAWAVTPAGRFVYRTSNSAIAAPSDYSDWAVLADQVRGTLTGDQAFAMSTDRVEIGLEITVGDATVPLATDAVSQAKGEGSPATCW